MDKESLLQELELLNTEVKCIIAKRSKFLDDKGGAIMDKEILLQELELLNLEVKRIIAKRSKFLDDNMHRFSR